MLRIQIKTIQNLLVLFVEKVKKMFESSLPALVFISVMSVLIYVTTLLKRKLKLKMKKFLMSCLLL